MTTNQAFIKAYRQDAAETATLRPTTAPSARASASVPGTYVEYVSVGGAPPAATYDGTNIGPERESAGGSGTHWPTCEAPFGRTDTPSSGKRPLSSFTAVRRANEHARRTTASAAKLEPATIVASFAWPPVCRILCQQFGPQFDRVAQLLLRQADEGRSLIGVMGLFPGRGTTTTLLCLAARLAAGPRRTIVVEGNFLAPRLSEWLDAEPTAWWQDVLERGASVADAIVRASDDNLELLPLGAESALRPRLAELPHVAKTAADLRQSYDMALVDLGAFFDPVSQPIALELVRNLGIDAVLAVAGPQPADPRDLATMADYLRQCGCELLGTIENRISKTPLTPDP